VALKYRYLLIYHEWLYYYREQEFSNLDTYIMLMVLTNKKYKAGYNYILAASMFCLAFNDKWTNFMCIYWFLSASIANIAIPAIISMLKVVSLRKLTAIKACHIQRRIKPTMLLPIHYYLGVYQRCNRVGSSGSSGSAVVTRLQRWSVLILLMPGHFP